MRRVPGIIITITIMTDSLSRGRAHVPPGHRSRRVAWEDPARCALMAILGSGPRMTVSCSRSPLDVITDHRHVITGLDPVICRGTSGARSPSWLRAMTSMVGHAIP